MTDSLGSVLHICSDYAKQDVYARLVQSLRGTCLDQVVYVPVRTREELARQPLDQGDALRFRFGHVLRPWHRILFRSKARTVFEDLLRQVETKGVQLVHAHFLYSDGAVAVRLKRERGIPFVVAVRNTDLNYFMRLRPDLRELMLSVVAEAEAVVFISPSYRDEMLRRLSGRSREVLQRKAVVVPNGVAPYWLENAPPAVAASEGRSTLRLLYVGDLSRNKNVMTTVRAAALIAAERPVRLTIVGGGGDGEDDLVRTLASGGYPFVARHPRVADTAVLRDIYRRHDLFVMPSFRETFGVAYIEALSQGLPVVHSIGQGIDGYFAAETVSEAVDPSDPVGIAQAIVRLAARSESVRAGCIEQAGHFRWETIAGTYRELYRAAASGSGLGEAS